MSERKTKKKIEIKADEPISERAKANTVKGKRALYQQTAKVFELAGNEMLASGIRDLQAGVREIQVGVFEKRVLAMDQINKFKAGAVVFQSGVAELVSAIGVMRLSFDKQVVENQEYAKQFYG